MPQTHLKYKTERERERESAVKKTIQVVKLPVSANLFIHRQIFVFSTFKTFYGQLYITKSPIISKIEIKTTNFGVKTL
jgi:hypothetical protein